MVVSFMIAAPYLWRGPLSASPLLRTPPPRSDTASRVSFKKFSGRRSAAISPHRRAEADRAGGPACRLIGCPPCVGRPALAAVRYPDDRLAGPATFRGEGGRHFGERSNGPDDRLQPTGPHPFSEVGQPAPVRLDDEEDRPAVGRSHVLRVGDRDERAAGAYQRS